MTTEAPIFSPEVEELLREIAAEPDSMLLRMPREKVRSSLLESRSPVGPMTAGLSRAERELVQVHREEFAFQLRRAAWIKLAGDGIGPDVVSRDWQATQRIPVPSENEVREGIASAARSADSPEGPAPAVPGWIDHPVVEWPSVSCIAALAHRISPKSQDLIYAGADCLIQRRPDTALDYFEAALRIEAEPELAGAIIANIANCHDQLNELPESVAEWRLAYHRAPHRLDYLAGWFLVSMQLGQDQDIESVDRELGFLGQHSARFENLAECFTIRRLNGYWVPRSTVNATLSRWRTRLSAGGCQLAISLS